MSAYPTVLPRGSAPEYLGSHDVYTAGPAEEPAGGVTIDIDKLAAEIKRDRVEDIRAIVRELTYGEMIAMCKAISLHFPPEQNSFCLLPGTMHRWSKE